MNIQLKPRFWMALMMAGSLFLHPFPVNGEDANEEGEVMPDQPVTVPGGGIQMNFKNAPLSDVLQYLSEAAGFVVVQESVPRGTVNIVSHQPVTPSEAVDLLNAVLIDKGYVALQNGRILKIVARKGVQKSDIPIRMGGNPEDIPRKDEVVTQIIPVRFADAAKLVDNLRSFLSEDTILTTNESSNTLILTDTLTNVRRIVEIVHALDTSISDVKEIRVFQLKNADSREVADLLNKLFEDGNTTTGNSGGSSGFPDFSRFFRGRSSGDRGRSGGSSNSPSLAQSKLTAVGDPRTNSVLVTAAREMMDQVGLMIERLDASKDKKQKVKVYQLENADADNVAAILRGIFDTSGASTATTRGTEGTSRLTDRQANGASSDINNSADSARPNAR